MVTEWVTSSFMTELRLLDQSNPDVTPAEVPVLLELVCPSEELIPSVFPQFLLRPRVAAVLLLVLLVSPQEYDCEFECDWDEEELSEELSVLDALMLVVSEVPEDWLALIEAVTPKPLNPAEPPSSCWEFEV